MLHDCMTVSIPWPCLVYAFFSSFKSGLSRIAPCFAGINAPCGGSLLALNVSQICSIVTHSTPSLVLMYSMILAPRQYLSSKESRLLHSPFQHHQRVRVSTDVRMDCHRINEFVVLPIEVVELIEPQLLNVSRIDPTVAIRRRFNKEHGREVVKVPSTPQISEV